ncbi:MAG TPA: alpha/beta hydrolase, partial [Woeseiaceae bacterium]
LKAGNETLFYALADSLVQDPHYMSQGLRYAVNCYEHIPYATAEALAEDRALHPRLVAFQEFTDEQAICAAWHPVRAGPVEQQAVTSDIPTLVAAGEFDPITPPSYARLAAESLRSATLFEVRGASHGVIVQSDCAQRIMQVFLDDPQSPPDTSCIASLERGDFITSAHANPGIYRLLRQLQEPPGTATLVGLGVMILLIASALLVWPIAWLIRRKSRDNAETPAHARQARTLEFLTALLIVVFLAGLAWAIIAALQQSVYLPAVGVSAWAAPLFLLPWLIALLTLVLSVFVLLAWKHRWWGITGSIYFSLVAAACAGFVLSAVHLGLM